MQTASLSENPYFFFLLHLRRERKSVVHLRRRAEKHHARVGEDSVLDRLADKLRAAEGEDIAALRAVLQQITLKAARLYVAPSRHCVLHAGRVGREKIRHLRGRFVRRARKPGVLHYFFSFTHRAAHHPVEPPLLNY